MSPDWQRQRNAINHDWLKNEFIRHLRAFVSRTEAPEPDRARLAEFVSQDWPKWEGNRDRLATLLASAETELSPRQLFARPPLCRCQAEAKVWLSDVVHVLWLARTSIRHLIGDAQMALAESDGRYKQLDPLLRSGKFLDQDRRPEVLDLFRKFEADVEKLSASMSRLPHKIQVV